MRRLVDRLSSRDAVRAAYASCAQLTPVWPQGLRGDLGACLACIKAWIGCPCERHARTCFERVGRHGEPPLDGELVLAPMAIDGVTLDQAGEQAHWAVEEALKAASFEWFREQTLTRYSIAWHAERSISGAINALGSRERILDAIATELGLDASELDEGPIPLGSPSPVPSTSVDAPAPTTETPVARELDRDDVRRLVSQIVAELLPSADVREHLVELKDQRVGADWSYRIVVEWTAARLRVAWTYESVRCMGIDKDQVLTVEVDGSRALLDHRGLSVDSSGRHHVELRRLLERCLFGGALGSQHFSHGHGRRL